MQASFSPFLHPRAVAEIDTTALSHNYQAVSRVCGKTIAVVKADAYGHGLSLAVPAFLRAGCDFFAVATAQEALAVRKLTPFADILLLGYAPMGEIPMLARAGVTLSVFSRAHGEALACAAAQAGTKIPVHLKIDGGMCRLGFSPADMDGILHVLKLPYLDVCGIFTHFPCADTDCAKTSLALTRFCSLREKLPVKLFAHAAASAAALTLPEARLDAVRVGIALYGYPSVQASLSLRPTMRVVAPVVQLRRVAAGTHVGYGGDFICTRNSVIGTVPLGYADGIFRTLTGHFLTVTCGKRTFSAPIVGRVCMDYLMLDLSDLPAKEGETVCILEDFSAAARHAGTIPYELLTAISPRVIRRRKGEL